MVRLKINDLFQGNCLGLFKQNMSNRNIVKQVKRMGHNVSGYTMHCIQHGKGAIRNIRKTVKVSQQLLLTSYVNDYVGEFFHTKRKVQDVYRHCQQSNSKTSKTKTQETVLFIGLVRPRFSNDVLKHDVYISVLSPQMGLCFIWAIVTVTVVFELIRQT